MQDPNQQTVNWGGYPFMVYSYETDWNEVAGLYVFSGFRLTSEFQQRWISYYIGSTESFRKSRNLKMNTNIGSTESLRLNVAF